MNKKTKIFFLIMLSVLNFKVSFSDEVKRDKLLGIKDVEQFKILYEKEFDNLSRLELVNILNDCTTNSKADILQVVFNKNNIIKDETVFIESLLYASECLIIKEEYAKIYFSEIKIQEALNNYKKDFMFKAFAARNYFIIAYLLKNKLIILDKKEQFIYFKPLVASLESYYSDFKNIKVNHIENLDVCIVRILTFFENIKEPSNLSFKVFFEIISRKLSSQALKEVLKSELLKNLIIKALVTINQDKNIVGGYILNKEFENLKNHLNSDQDKSNSEEIAFYLNISAFVDYKEGFDLITNFISENSVKLSHNEIASEICSNICIQNQYIEDYYKKVIKGNDKLYKIYVQHTCFNANSRFFQFFFNNGLNENAFKMEYKSMLDYFMHQYGGFFFEKSHFHKVGFTEILNILIEKSSDVVYDEKYASLYKMILEGVYSAEELKMPLFNCFRKILK